MAAGSIAHNERTRSSWNVNHGLLDVDGSIGQYGSDCVSMYAPQAMAPASSICTQASARRGRAMLREIAEPTLASLEFFYPRLSPGGMIVLDDHGFAGCPGARRAAVEYFADKADPVLDLATGQGVVFRSGR